jgi:hypothetical protein
MQINFDDVTLVLGLHELQSTVDGSVEIEDGEITEIVIDGVPAIRATAWSADPIARAVWVGMYDRLERMFLDEIAATADIQPPDRHAMRELV